MFAYLTSGRYWHILDIDTYENRRFFIELDLTESERYQVTKQKSKKRNLDELSLWSAFWSGFLWPIKKLRDGLAWLAHHPPLKQIGHGLRWFFRLKPLRFFGRMLGLAYLRDSWRELKGVTWPTRKESLRLTTAVIIFSTVFGLMIAVVDYGLDKAFRHILIR